ncbi:MAG: hypothetical protein ACLFPL_00940 [Candidatus Nanoarchaeia archaeon]
MFGIKSTKRGEQIENLIHDLRTIFTNIQIQLKTRDSEQEIQKLKEQFIKLSGFRLKNELELLKVSTESTQLILSKMVDIFEYFVSKNEYFQWELFDKKLDELEYLGNNLGFTFNLGSDLKSIFLVQYDSSEMEKIMTLLYERIENLSRELSSQIQESNNRYVDFYMNRITSEITHVFHLAIHSVEIPKSLKQEIYHIYTYLGEIREIYRHIDNLNEDDINKFNSLRDKLDEFFHKFGGIVVGKISIGFIVRECCFEHLLNINVELIKQQHN